MNYYAITINNSKLINKYRRIEQVYQHFQQMPITVYIIAVERNEINENIHYHLLIGAEMPITSIDDEFVWWKELQTDIEVMKYASYIKKDGKYKIYNALALDNENDTKYHQMLNACQTYNKFSDMILDNPNFIKHIHQLRMLWHVIKTKQ